MGLVAQRCDTWPGVFNPLSLPWWLRVPSAPLVGAAQVLPEGVSIVDGDRRRQAVANGRGVAVSCRVVRIDGSLCAGHLSDSVGGVVPLVWASRNASQIGRHLDVGLPDCLQLRAAKTGYASYKQSNSRLIVGFGPAGPGPIFIVCELRQASDHTGWESWRNPKGIGRRRGHGRMATPPDANERLISPHPPPGWRSDAHTRR